MHVRRFYVSSHIPKKRARLIPAPHSVSFPPSLLVSFVPRIGSNWQRRDQKSAAAQIHSQNSKKLLRVASFRGKKKIWKGCWTVPNIKDSKCQKQPEVSYSMSTIDWVFTWKPLLIQPHSWVWGPSASLGLRDQVTIHSAPPCQRGVFLRLSKNLESKAYRQEGQVRNGGCCFLDLPLWGSREIPNYLDFNRCLLSFLCAVLRVLSKISLT